LEADERIFQNRRERKVERLDVLGHCDKRTKESEARGLHWQWPNETRPSMKANQAKRELLAHSECVAAAEGTKRSAVARLADLHRSILVGYDEKKN
jgi:hypothetical protein